MDPVMSPKSGARTGRFTESVRCHSCIRSTTDVHLASGSVRSDSSHKLCTLVPGPWQTESSMILAFDSCLFFFGSGRLRPELKVEGLGGSHMRSMRYHGAGLQHQKRRALAKA